jgi:hypothetical protein
MNCYTHNDAPAIGICKHCNKGICLSCCADTGAGLACRASCVEEVEGLNRLIHRNKQTTAFQRRNAYLFPAFFGLSGLLFFIFGITSEGRAGFAAVMGVGFMLFAVVYAYIVSRWVSGVDRR